MEQETEIKIKKLARAYEILNRRITAQELAFIGLSKMLIKNGFLEEEKVIKALQGNREKPNKSQDFWTIEDYLHQLGESLRPKSRTKANLRILKLETEE